ncbi:MAG TPA: B12-binding domain-containing radical SAM protein, partial [Polyangia bacterium]
CAFPRYARSFGTFHHAYRFFGGRVTAFMPPQGLLVVAAYLPAGWQVRFVDENAGPVTDGDLRWADVLFTSGMHVQRGQIEDLARRAHAHGIPVVLGGPSVSAAPEQYPGVDILHIGELGDATDDLIAHLDRDVGRPARQLRFETRQRLALSEFPTPAYDRVSLDRYFIASVQYSSGCPYSCEFCDIPALYGRNPRLKSPDQVLAELDRIVAGGAFAVYFVDDNFIGNQKAAVSLLEQLVAWQRRNRYPLRFACEATLNLARNERVLTLMREARFETVFCGIETPEPAALRSISKAHNLRMPILDAVARLNASGLEVVSGIILGLDSDTAQTGDNVLAFIEASRIPVLTINLLHALPRTPLWRRLEGEGRLTADGARASNVAFKLGYDQTVDAWLRCVSAAYRPEAIYARFAHNVAETFSRRKPVPTHPRRRSPASVARGLAILLRVLWRLGVRGRYRRTFWKMALPLLRAGRIESLIHVAIVSHHMIEFTRECARDRGEAAFYAAPPAAAAPAAPGIVPIRPGRAGEVA